MLVCQILLGVLLYLWISFLWRRRRFYMLALKTPGPLGLPIFGVLHRVKSLEGIFHFTADLQKKYVSPILTWIGTIPMFCVADPPTIQDILTSPICVNKSTLYETVSNAVGNGLLSISNPDWAIHRRLLNPAFNTDNLRSFMPIFNEKAKAFAQDFETLHRDSLINMLPIMQKLSMSISLQTTMDLKNINRITLGEYTEDKLFKYYDYFAEKIPAMVITPWTRLKFVQEHFPSMKPYIKYKRELQQFYVNYIGKKFTQSSIANFAKEEAESLYKKPPNIFIDIALDLMKNGQFTAQNVEDHSNHIVAGAFDTTATSITHALILLAMNPKCQDIAYEELASLYANRDDVTVTYEDLSSLVYLEMVINETMRLLPTIPIVSRTTTGDVTLSNGIILPEGVQIMISLFDLHRDKNIWGPNALTFDPENFLPDNMRNKHPYAYIPFMKGIRNCIGWRYGMYATKVILAILLRKFRFSTTGKFEELRYIASIAIKLKDPPLLKFELREK